MAAMDDELRTQGEALADAVVAAVPGWVRRSVERFAVGLDVDDAARAAVAEIEPALRAVLTADVDEQRVNPLAIVRDAVQFPTALLRDAGIEPPARSRFDVEHFPDDVYGLVPMTWRDIDESLHEPGIVWGATKAMAHRRRHQS